MVLLLHLRRMLLTDPIQRAASRLHTARLRVEALEAQLQALVAARVDAHAGGSIVWAREIGISPQYASDIRHGRRKISAAVVAKILGGK